MEEVLVVKLINERWKFPPLPYGRKEIICKRIYKIKYKKCPKYYIGQTGRSFSCRFKEHIQAIKSNNSTTPRSMFAEHILDSDHEYGKLKECMDILGYETKGDKMNTKEELHIYLNSKADNDILNKMQIQN